MKNKKLTKEEQTEVFIKELAKSVVNIINMAEDEAGALININFKGTLDDTRIFKMSLQEAPND